MNNCHEFGDFLKSVHDFFYICHCDFSIALITGAVCFFSKQFEQQQYRWLSMAHHIATYPRKKYL